MPAAGVMHCAACSSLCATHSSLTRMLYSHEKANFGLLNLAVLNKCADNSEVTYETCLEAGHMTKLHIKKGPTVLRGKQLVKVLFFGSVAGL